MELEKKKYDLVGKIPMVHRKNDDGETCLHGRFIRESNKHNFRNWILSIFLRILFLLEQKAFNFRLHGNEPRGYSATIFHAEDCFGSCRWQLLVNGMVQVHGRCGVNECMDFKRLKKDVGVQSLTKLW